MSLIEMPRFARTDFPAGDLMARIRELEAELAAERAKNAELATHTRVARVATRARKGAPDWRTAAECWLAGEPVVRPSRAAYKRSKAPQTVRVDFADGESVRLSTTLDGPEGIAECVRTARASRQGRPRMVDRLRARAAKNETSGEWVRDAVGRWRCVEVWPCPAVLSAEFVECE